MKRMKLHTKLLVAVFMLFVSSKVTAQTAVAESLDSLQANPIKYMTPMEYAFMFHEETPWMAKGSVAQTSGFYGLLQLGFEHRIKGAFTISVDANFLSEGTARTFTSSLRYYYNMSNRKSENGIPFNLSGNYISAGTNLLFTKRYEAPSYRQIGKEFSLLENTNLQPTYFVQWGMQRRYLKSAYIDIGLRASMNRQNRWFGYNNFFLSSTTEMGFAFARDKSKLKTDKLCSVIKCQEEHLSMLRLNTSRLFFANFNKYFGNVRFNPEISYERKIKKSSFSINQNLVLVSIYNKTAKADYFGLAGSYNVETRYYYNLQRRIRKGKSGNGFSANYIAVGMYNSINQQRINFYFYSSLMPPDYTVGQLNISTGIQRFIGERFYFDIGLGYLPKGISFSTNYLDEFYGNVGNFNLYNKVGYRF